MIRTRTGGAGAAIALFVLVIVLLLFATQSGLISIPTEAPLQTGITLQPIQNAADNVIVSISSTTGISTGIIIVAIMAAIIVSYIQKRS